MSIYLSSYSHLYICTVFGGWFPFVLCVLHLASQLSPTLCDLMDCSPPGSSVHGILQARILEWVAMPSSRESSPPRDQTHISCTAGRFLTTEPMGNPSFSSTEFFYFHKHILSFECVFFITSCSFFIDVVSSPFLLRILNIDFFFLLHSSPCPVSIFPKFLLFVSFVLSLYSLSSYCLFPFLYMSSYHNSDMS